MHHPRFVLCKLGGSRYVKTQLSLFISVINQLDAQNFWSYNKFISCLYMLRAHVLIIRKSKFTLIGVMIPEAVQYNFNLLMMMITVSLFHASTCFEHMCSSSGSQNCIVQSLVLSHL